MIICIPSNKTKGTKKAKVIKPEKLNGTIVEIDRNFYVWCNNTHYKIHVSSYNTQGVRKVYAKDDNDRWFTYDRVIIEDRRRMPKNYVPFKPGFECIGQLIEDNNKQYFKISKSYNPKEVGSKTKAIKELEDELSDE